MFFVWSSSFVFGFTPVSVTWISSLKRVQTWKSQVWHCKDPISKIQDFQKTFLGSRAEILDPDPRSKILKNLCWKTLDPAIPFGSKISALDPRKVFWKYWILDLGFVRPGIRSLTAVQTWNPKSEVPLGSFNLMSFMYMYMYMYMYHYVSAYVYL